VEPKLVFIQGRSKSVIDVLGPFKYQYYTTHCDFRSVFKVAGNDNSHTEAVRNYFSSFARSVPCALYVCHVTQRLGGMSDFMWGLVFLVHVYS